MDNLQKESVAALYNTGNFSIREISTLMGIPKSTIGDFLHPSEPSHKDWWELRKHSLELRQSYSKLNKPQPRILSFDIETAPLKGSFWGLWDQRISLDMIDLDWYVLSYAAKWLGEDNIFYEDKRSTFDTEDDSKLLIGIWNLLDEADMIITQNGKKFDVKKLYSRFIEHGMKPPRSFKHVDTCEQARKQFGFTSNKLEFLSQKLCKKYKKLKHSKFPGYSLWGECLKGNLEAWNEMEEYNINDVLTLEELYGVMRPWMKGHPNMGLYAEETTCVCGSTSFTHSGFHYTGTSKFNKFQCDVCGYEMRDSVNLAPKNILRNII